MAARTWQLARFQVRAVDDDYCLPTRWGKCQFKKQAFNDTHKPMLVEVRAQSLENWSVAHHCATQKNHWPFWSSHWHFTQNYTSWKPAKLHLEWLSCSICNSRHVFGRIISKSTHVLTRHSEPYRALNPPNPLRNLPASKDHQTSHSHHDSIFY